MEKATPKPWVEFAPDSPLEGDGFELPVPRTTPGFWPISTRTTRRDRCRKLVRLRQCVQTGRQGRRLADDRGFRCRSFADLMPDDHRSGGDADPHRELDPG